MRMCSRGVGQGTGAVHFLLKKHRAQFRSLAAKFDARQDASAAWAEVFGDGLAGLSREFGDWLRNTPSPGGSYGRAGSSAASASRAVFDHVAGRAEADAAFVAGSHSAWLRRAAAGLVFGYRSASDFYLFMALPNSTVRVVRRDGSGWTWAAPGGVGAIKDCSVLSVTQ